MQHIGYFDEFSEWLQIIEYDNIIIKTCCCHRLRSVQDEWMSCQRSYLADYLLVSLIESLFFPFQGLEVVTSPSRVLMASTLDEELLPQEAPFPLAAGSLAVDPLAVDPLAVSPSTAFPLATDASAAGPLVTDPSDAVPQGRSGLEREYLPYLGSSSPWYLAVQAFAECSSLKRWQILELLLQTVNDCQLFYYKGPDGEGQGVSE